MAFLFFDEHLGTAVPAGEARFDAARITVRDLIRARVELELEKMRDHSQSANGRFAGSAAEEALNGPRLFGGGASAIALSDPDACIRDAEKAFELGRYYLFLGDEQAEDLDALIDLDKTGEATFVLLTPLQGG
ncbi:hypothetical protein [Sphingomicrobium arenosum]|uniref:hypothetical protein n=1 Tax=Sphingomicrobium arenosum TaxID=2233861 RepID=UPI002240EDEC|nr:hypothetical protein [Sphingomicrobium arenosum]